MKKNIVCIIGIEFDFTREPRILQEIYALRGQYHLIGVGKSPHPDVDEFIDITKNKKLLDVFLDKILRYIKYYFPFLLRFRYRRVLKHIDKIKPDCISVHHIESAILAYGKSNKMIFNSHEFIPKQNDGNLLWKLSKGWMINRNLPKVFKHTFIMYVEGDAVKEAYLNYFRNVPKMVVIPNATKAWPDLIPAPVMQKDIKIVHHGLASIGRGLEIFIDVAGILGSGYSLHLYLMKSDIFPEYYNRLKKYSSRFSNVYFYDVVPYDNIVPTINRFDIGLCLFKSGNYHTQFTTVPNKFWEYISARVVPLVSKESAMARICESNQFGIVSEKPEVQEIVKTILDLKAADIFKQKKRLNDLHEQFIAEKCIYPIIINCVKQVL